MLARSTFYIIMPFWERFCSDKMPNLKDGILTKCCRDNISYWQNVILSKNHFSGFFFYFVPALSWVRGECWQGHNTLYIFIELHHYESTASLEEKKVSGCLVAHIVDVKLFWINNSSSAMTKAGRKTRFFKCFLVLQSGLHIGYFFCRFQNALVCNNGIV